MKRNGLKRTKYIAAMLVFSLAIGVFSPTAYLAPDSVKAAESSSSRERWAPVKLRRYGITYKDFIAKNGELTEPHLLVGTYLIDMVPTEEAMQAGEGAVTGQIYQAALTSKLTYSQNVAFYKSELADGEWRDIDASDTITTITTDTAKTVPAYEMDEMLITVYVKGGKAEPANPEGNDDGNDSRVNPFLNPSPYNLDEMPEMAELLSMTTDGTLSYKSDGASDADIAKNQSNRFMSERLNYLFAHDEVTNTLKLHPNDGERAKVLTSKLSLEAGSADNKLVESNLDTTERNGTLILDPMRKLSNDKKKAAIYSIGDDGSIASTFRLAYHFSDTRDEITEPMDKAVTNLWDVYLEYKDAAKAAGEEEEKFEAPKDTVTNKVKYNFLYQVMSYSDSVRRGEAYYNLAANEQFHNGTGSVLSQIKKMNDKGKSDIGRNIQNTEYFVPYTVTGVGFLGKMTSKGGFAKNDTLAEAIDKAIEGAKNKYVDYSAYTFTRGNTAVSQYIYDQEMKLVEKKKKDAETDTLLENLIFASNIKDGNILVTAREKELLYKLDSDGKLMKGTLVSTQNDILAEHIAKGLPDNYNIVGAKEEDLKALLVSQQSSGRNSEAAMEKLIDAYLLRETDKETYTKTLNAQLAWIRGQKSNIKNTDYASYAEDVRDRYEQYLIKKMKELGIDVPDDGSGEGDAIDWDKGIKDANDDGNLKLAGEIKKLKDKYEGEKKPVPTGYTASLDVDPKTGLPYVKYTKKDDGSGTDSGSGSGGGNGNGNEGSAGKNSSNGGGMGGSSDGSGGNGSGNGGSGNGSGTGTGDKGKNNGGGNGSGGKSDKNGGNGDGNGGSGNDGNGTGNNDNGKNGNGGDGNGEGSGLLVPDGDMLDNLLAYLGKSWDELDPQGKAELVVALNQFGTENNNQEALTLARNLLQTIMFEKNPLVYTQYRAGNDMEYVSFGAVDRARLYTRFRLVKEGLDITMTRTDLGLTYVYRLGSVKITLIDGKTEDMLTPMVSQGDRYMNRGELRHPYISEDDALSKINCRAEYINDTIYAVLVTASMEPHIEELVEALEDMYKYV